MEQFKVFQEKITHEKLIEKFDKQLFLRFVNVYTNELRPALGISLTPDTYTKLHRCMFFTQDDSTYWEAFDLTMQEIKAFNENIYYSLVKYLYNLDLNKFTVTNDTLFEFYSYLKLIEEVSDKAVRNELNLLFEDTISTLDKKIANYFNADFEMFNKLHQLAVSNGLILDEDLFFLLTTLIEEDNFKNAFILLLKELFLQKGIIVYLLDSELKIAKLKPKEKEEYVCETSKNLNHC